MSENKNRNSFSTNPDSHKGINRVKKLENARSERKQEFLLDDKDTEKVSNLVNARFDNMQGDIPPRPTDAEYSKIIEKSDARKEDQRKIYPPSKNEIYGLPDKLDTIKHYKDALVWINPNSDTWKRDSRDFLGQTLYESKSFQLKIVKMLSKKIKKQETKLIPYLPFIEDEQVEKTIAREVTSLLGIKTTIELNDMRIFEKGVYEGGNIAKNKIKQVTVLIAGDTLICNKNGIFKYRLTTPKINMITEFIKTSTFVSINDFDQDPNIINLKDGLYHVYGFDDISNQENKHFKPHISLKDDPEPYLSMFQYDIEYMKNEKGDEIINTMNNVLGDATDLMMEYIAYIFMNSVKYSKALMLYGETGTGKTTVLNIIKRLIGHEKTSGVSLQALSERFQIANLRNKKLNIYDDLSNKKIGYTDEFNRVVTNSRLTGELKGIQDNISWHNSCKLMFACNILPETFQNTPNSFWKRWILICCQNDFYHEKTEDNSMRDKEWSKEEIAGLFNAVMDAWRRLEKRGDFEKQWLDREYVKNRWQIDINPVALFVNQHCEISKSNEVDYGTFYKHLNAFRTELKAPEITKASMTRGLKRMNDNIKKIKVEKKYNEGSSGFKFVGIDFNPEYKENAEHFDTITGDLDKWFTKNDKTDKKEPTHITFGSGYPVPINDETESEQILEPNNETKQKIGLFIKETERKMDQVSKYHEEFKQMYCVDYQGKTEKGNELEYEFLDLTSMNDRDFFTLNEKDFNKKGDVYLARLSVLEEKGRDHLIDEKKANHLLNMANTWNEVDIK